MFIIFLKIHVTRKISVYTKKYCFCIVTNILDIHIKRCKKTNALMSFSIFSRPSYTPDNSNEKEECCFAARQLANAINE